MSYGNESAGRRLAIAITGTALTLGGSLAAHAADSALHAARDGDLPSLTAVLKKDRAAANLGSADGSTPLIWAAFRGDVSMIKALIAARADVNAKNAFEVSPLLLAARSGNSEAVLALVNAGADIAGASRQGETVLMAAARSGASEAVRELLAGGQDPNAKDDQEQQTALMWAADEQHVEVVEMLLAAGADAKAMARTSALGSDETNGGNAGVRADWPRGGMTPLTFAVRRGNLEIARMLIAAGADVNTMNPVKMTPLLIAVLNDHLDLAAELLTAGAIPNDATLYETVRLHNLKVDARQGDESRPRPINVNQIDPVRLVSLLLDKGADPNVVPGHTLNTDGVGNPRPNTQSPYALALQMQDTAILRLLLERGAVDASSQPGEDAPTPLMAINVNSPVNAIFGGAGVGPMRYRVERSPLAAAQVLVEFGADVNRQAGQFAETAVHRAVLMDNAEMIRFLAQHGAKLDIPNSNGQTPVDYANAKVPPTPPNPNAPPGANAPRPKPEALAALKELLGPASQAGTRTATTASAAEPR